MGRATASRHCSRPSTRELELRADALDGGFAAAGHRWQRLPRRWHAVAAGGRAGRGAARAPWPTRLGLAADAEVTLEANPGRRRDRRPRRASGRRASTGSRSGAQSMDDGELRAAGPATPGRPTCVAAVGCRTRGRARLGQPRPAHRYPGPDARARGAPRSSAALALEPDHLSVYTLTLDDPDAEGLTGPEGDHLPVSRGARRLARASRRASSPRSGPPRWSC